MVVEDTIERIKQISNEIKAKNFLPFYFLYGNEDYFISNIRKSILNAFEDETKINLKIYDNNNFNFVEIIKYIANVPLLNDKKLIVFKDVDFFKQTENNIESKNNNYDAFIDAIDKNKDINIIVVSNLENDDDYNKHYKNNPILKYFNDNGIALKIDKLDNSSLSKMASARFKRYKIEIDKLTLAYFINQCGNDLSNLFNEIDKLVSFVSDKGNVNKNDVDEIVCRSLDDRVYNLIELYNNKKNEAALKYYGDLLSEGVYKKDEIFRIFASNYIFLIACKDLMLKNKSLKEISDLIGLPSWRVKKLMDSNKYTNIDSLKNKLKEITNLSNAKVSGNIIDDYMLILLMNKG